MQQRGHFFATNSSGKEKKENLLKNRHMGYLCNNCNATALRFSSNLVSVSLRKFLLYMGVEVLKK